MDRTIYDVAHEAGVSISTVSRALNNTGYVSEKTRAKIEAAMNGFYPNAAAKAMMTKRSNVIGVVSFLSPKRFFLSGTLSNSLAGILDYTKQNDYQVTLDIGSADFNCIEMYRKKQIDAIIFISYMSNPELIKQIHELKIPVAFMGDTITKDDELRVQINNKRGAFEAVEYLISLGHRRIALINGRRFNPPSENRYSGFLAALLNAEIVPDESLVVFCEESIEEHAYRAAMKLLQMPNRPTAIFAYNDDMAMGVYHAARELNIAIPEQLSVIGFDDSKVASLVFPPLTTVAQPSYYKGFLVAEKMITYLRSLENGQTDIPSSELLECKLIVRDSCSQSAI